MGVRQFGGFLVSFRVKGVLLEFMTTAGQAANHVAQEVADRINGDPTLQGQSVSAVVTGSTVYTNGVFSDFLVADPGLTIGIHAVPALSLPGLLLCVLGLLVTGLTCASPRCRWVLPGLGSKD